VDEDNCWLDFATDGWCLAVLDWGLVVYGFGVLCLGLGNWELDWDLMIPLVYITGVSGCCNET